MTDDGRYIIVNGRRWRATDPTIPEALRKELVGELMDARRGVKVAKDDPEALLGVRARVHNAKVALGERGEAWWEEPTADGLAVRIRAAILTLLARRGQDGSVRPSEVARVVASPDWQHVLGAVEAEAAELSRSGQICMTESESSEVETSDIDGHIRLRSTESSGAGSNDRGLAT